MALCLAVFCPSYVFAQRVASDYFSSGPSGSDAFSSGVAATPMSPLEMRRIRTKYYHEEQSRSFSVVGDEFAGYGPNLIKDLDISLFSEAGKNDPFASGVPKKEWTYVTGAPSYYPVANWAEPTGGQWDSFTSGDAFSSGDRFSREPNLRGWTGNRRSRSRMVAFGFNRVPQLQGATNGTIGPASSFNTSQAPRKNSAPHWETARLPLKVYISGTVEYARNGLFRNEIKSALRAWREASGGKLNYVITTRFTEADIYFVCQQTADGQWAENITEFHQKMYDRVKVCFLEDTLLKLEPKRVRALCLHEIGHALGIMKHSTNNQDAMSLSATDDFHPIVVLTNGDRRIISSLYCE